MSRLVAPPLLTMNPACLSETCAPPTDIPLSPQSEISLPAKFPAGRLNVLPVEGTSSGCEARRFSISSRTRDIYANGDLSSMWKGYDIPVVKFDGNDIISVLEAVETAVERAREGKGPSVLEGVTYRISAHIPMEAQFEYRTVDEVNEWREKDPIPRARAWLIEHGVWDMEQDESLKEQLFNEVRERYAALEKTPIVDRSEMFTMVYYGK